MPVREAAPLPVRQAGCLCGALRFTATPLTRGMAACHCAKCRRWTGGINLAVECKDDLAFEDRSALGVWVAAEWIERGFCTRCSSPLFYRLFDGRNVCVPVYAFDTHDDFVLETEYLVDEQPGHYTFANVTHRVASAEFFAGKIEK